MYPSGYRRPGPNMRDYDATYRDFHIEVPEYFNFGFDVIDAWAKKDRNKLAMIWTNQKGDEKKYTFWDLMRLSNQVVNMLIRYGVNKGDRVLIMLPRYRSGGSPLLPSLNAERSTARPDHAYRTRPEVPD